MHVSVDIRIVACDMRILKVVCICVGYCMGSVVSECGVGKGSVEDGVGVSNSVSSE